MVRIMYITVPTYMCIYIYIYIYIYLGVLAHMLFHRVFSRACPLKTDSSLSLED